MKSALCIGINDYPGTSADLQGCVNDAQDWSEALGRRGFQVETLLDGQATHSSMLNRMQALVDEASYGDSLIITYSGHGTWLPDSGGDEPDGRDEALCPSDIYLNGALTDDSLYDIFIRRARGVRLVFISDSCHSGSVNRFANFGDSEEKVRFLPPEVYLQNRHLEVARAVAGTSAKTLPSRASALLLSGCRDFEYSYDARINGRFNGAFTSAALSALKELADTATYRDWMSLVRAYLPSQRYPQTPVLSGSYSQRTWKVLT